MSLKQDCSALHGVGCCVSGCKYHTAENRCTATGITVQNENAQKKAETFCSTFSPKCSSTSCQG